MADPKSQNIFGSINSGPLSAAAYLPNAMAEPGSQSSYDLIISPAMSGSRYLTQEGWSALQRNPRLVTDWVFWQSPNNTYWGPSTQLRDTLKAGGARVHEMNQIPEGALKYREEDSARRKGQINNENGRAAERASTRKFAGENGEAYRSQRFYEGGRQRTEVDAVVPRRSRLSGWTVHNIESKLGYSNNINQALFDQQRHAIPTWLAQQLNLSGTASATGGNTTLLHAPDVTRIKNGRFWGKIKGLGGAALGLADAALSAKDIIQAYQADDPELADLALTSGLSLAGLVPGLFAGALGASGLGTLIGLIPLHQQLFKQVVRDKPHLAEIAFEPFGSAIPSQVTNPDDIYRSSSKSEPKWSSTATPLWLDRRSPVPYFAEEYGALQPMEVPDDRDLYDRLPSTGVDPSSFGFTKLTDMGGGNHADVREPPPASLLPAWANTYFDRTGRLRPEFANNEGEPATLPFWEWYSR